MIFGKTNVPVGLADWQSYNPIYGVTNNPWNVEHTPGGSSGGSASALAAGLTGFEIGSDIGGSIRVPAAFCGVFGHKPTWGLCPPRGHSLFGAAAMTDISVIGPLARSADDLALGLGLLAGPDETGPRSPAAPRAAHPESRGIARRRLVRAARPRNRRRDRRAAQGARHLPAPPGGQAQHQRAAGVRPEEAYHVYLRLLNAALSGRMQRRDRGLDARQGRASGA